MDSLIGGVILIVLFSIWLCAAVLLLWAFLGNLRFAWYFRQAILETTGGQILRFYTVVLRMKK